MCTRPIAHGGRHPFPSYGASALGIESLLLSSCQALRPFPPLYSCLLLSQQRYCSQLHKLTAELGYETHHGTQHGHLKDPNPTLVLFCRDPAVTFSVPSCIVPDAWAPCTPMIHYLLFSGSARSMLGSCSIPRMSWQSSTISMYFEHFKNIDLQRSSDFETAILWYFRDFPSVICDRIATQLRSLCIC
jgi:hypothetical protein